MKGASRRAHDPARPRRSQSVSTKRKSSRSPRRLGTPEAEADQDKAVSESSAGWHEGKPGPGCSMEELRWYCIREIGQLQSNARAAGKNMQSNKIELEILKGRLNDKVDHSTMEAHIAHFKGNRDFAYY